jgi:hypothetical protein
MKIILVSAKAQSGKDFVSQILKSELESEGDNVLITHYADLLKYICKTFFEWNGGKDTEGRTLLQYIGSDIIRKKDPNYWVNFIISILKLFPNEWDYVIIPDTRFPNEIEELKSKFDDVITLRINRINFDNGLTEEQKNHISETSLDNYDFDYTIINDGTENIYNEVNLFLEKIKNE